MSEAAEGDGTTLARENSPPLVVEAVEQAQEGQQFDRPGDTRDEDFEAQLRLRARLHEA